MDGSVVMLENTIPVIDLTSDTSSCPEPRKKQLIKDSKFCNCPMCDIDQCLKMAKEVFPDGVISAKVSPRNIPKVVCRNNKHIVPMSSDDCLVRDYLKNAIEKG